MLRTVFSLTMHLYTVLIQLFILLQSSQDEKMVNIDKNVILQKEEAAKDESPSLNMNLEKPISNSLDKFTVRQRAVVNAAKRAWTGYKKYAWGHDHLKPISKQHQDWFHLALTLVDSLDTLYMMDMKSGNFVLLFQFNFKSFHSLQIFGRYLLKFYYFW